MQTAREHQQVLAMLVKSDLFRYYSERMIGLVMTGAEEASPSFGLDTSGALRRVLSEHQSSHVIHPV